MDQKMTNSIWRLVKRFSPKGTEFCWDDYCKEDGNCYYLCSKATGELTNCEIFISSEFANSHSEAEVKDLAIKLIARSRVPGHVNDKFEYVEYTLLKLMIEDEEAAEKAASSSKNNMVNY
jgi:hypothetical protein